MTVRRFALAAAVAAALATTACAAPAEPEASGSASSTSSSSESANSPSSSSASTTEPEPEEDGPKVVAYGTPDEGESWTVSVDSVTPYLDEDPDSISELIEKPAGSVYVVATATARNTSAVRQDPADLSGAFSYSGADLLVYDDEGGFGYMDDLISMANETLPGGTVTGNLLFTMPREAVSDTNDVSALNGGTGMLTTWSADPDHEVPAA